jgi:hypothetical protein
MSSQADAEPRDTNLFAQSAIESTVAMYITIREVDLTGCTFCGEGR